eukprot:scaffold105484_cov28-Tisochrysis_lutea.AAC.3
MPRHALELCERPILLESRGQVPSALAAHRVVAKAAGEQEGPRGMNGQASRHCESSNEEDCTRRCIA